MKGFVGLLLLAFMISACEQKLDREQLREDVMVVHDAVMPQWSQLKKLQKRVITKASELESINESDPEVAKLRKIAADLEVAHEVMYTWMRDWRNNAAPYEEGGKASDEEALKFFEKEQNRVDEMEQQLTKAYDAAMEALK